jgi:multidrug efflux pump subunit AcrB
VRLARELSVVPGATMFFQPVQDIRVGGRMSRAQYIYALQSGDLNELNRWSTLLLDKLRRLPELRDVSSDQQTGGLQTTVAIDRDAASRLGVSPMAIDIASKLKTAALIIAFLLAHDNQLFAGAGASFRISIP